MSDRLREIFSEIPARYERVNRVLTFGLDAVWRRAAANAAVAAGGSRFLDVCTGTGETAHLITRRAAPGALVVGADFTPPMMREGRRKRGRERIAFVAAAAAALPFPDGAFDVVTISFATRNLNVSRADLLAAFREFRRVLRPGGVFLNLETSRPPMRVVREIFHFYARHAVGRAGRIMTGSADGYAYLSGTLRSFCGADELAAVIAEAGFASASFRRLSLGVVALHAATK
jgi:demethylmenaquinone methyltransferase/2-methoxy-6-polyprenyl-1,4-benzoquinol methylase